MNSKEKIKNIKSVINEFYHTEKCEGRLTECANDCWKSYQKDCDEIKQDLDRLEKLENQLKDGTLSDGYHTFNDLYIQRMYLFATIVNQNKELAWKSLKHENGELCFGGNWFIVGIDTPNGSYTYHYENKYWDLFNCKELVVAKHWDGHTSKDVDRLLSLHHNAFDLLEKQVIILIEQKNNLAKQVKKWQEKYSLLEEENKEQLKKNQKLEKTFKKRAELCSELGEYNRQYEKALDFLMDKFKLELKGNRLYFLYNLQYFELDKEEEKLMKEAFGYEK